MTATTATRRELAHRMGDGLHVTLFWSKPADRVTVEVLDERLDERFEFDVEGRDALDAFHHPYAYGTGRAFDLHAAAHDRLAA
jgi:hypothetical protein